MRIQMRILNVFLTGIFLSAPICCARAAADSDNANDSAAGNSVSANIVSHYNGSAMALTNALSIARVSAGGRSPTHRDAIEAEIVSGNWRGPNSGDEVRLPNGSSQKWKPITADTNGWFSGAATRGGYVYAAIFVESNCAALLEASGDSMVYVNGAPRTGDPYENGYVHLPIPLRAGTNDLLFACARGRLKVVVAPPVAPVAFDLGDPTFPDMIAGEELNSWGAVVVLNSTPETQTGLVIRSTLVGGDPVETPLPAILPYSFRKVGFRLRGRASGVTNAVPLQLALLHSGGDGTILNRAETTLRVRRPDETQKRTFVSDIDGSVQYWALNPEHPVHGNDPAPALFLSVHGASVEAIGQADAYSPKSWGHIVVPTNRRPYGFDWESWGRMDALEVLKIAEAELHPDPSRIYLIGHSMGGHGTWQLGALFPDHFAAISPSAGWISFFSYAGERQFTNPTPVEAILQRATASSDTLLMATNYLQEGIYIIHGSDDDNVPVSEAREMVKRLSGFHHDFVYHEQPGVSHWWDVSDEPGADCVDWAPMFDFLAHHVIPSDESLRHINFTTVNPEISAKCHWLEVEQQQKIMEPSRVDIRWDPGKRRFVGTTENVERLALDLDSMEANSPFKVELDGQILDAIQWPTAAKLFLQRDGGTWRVSSEPFAAVKGPLRYGPFKNAFQHRMMFVYGTAGTPEENAWAFDKSRFDAEQFWYRGNGSIDVVPDTAFDPVKDPNRGVILYGNADSNRAWRELLAASPVQVKRGAVQIGSRTVSGDDLCCLLVRPRTGSDFACVAAVSGTGVGGMRVTDRLAYFLSGVEYPDCTVISASMLTDGIKGVRAAGFFGLDWSVENGDFAWQDGNTGPESETTNAHE